ncbi:hypothetical protein ACX6XY_03970 [Streptomyces sp. O3]
MPTQVNRLLRDNSTVSALLIFMLIFIPVAVVTARSPRGNGRGNG